jgi:hypothetical protein
MAWYNQNALSAQSDIDSLLAQIAANSDASGAYDPVFDAALAEARARASSGNMLSGLSNQIQDAGTDPITRASLQSLYDRYSGFQPIGTLGNIGIGGANTGTIGNTRYNYYTIGSNPGEYQIDPNGFVTSGSTQRDTNYLNPQGIAEIGNGQYAFITDPQNVPRMVAPAKDESMAGEAWSAYGPLVLAAAGNIVGPTLNSTFGTLGGSAVKGALSSALMGGNPLTGAALGGATSLAGGALSSAGKSVGNWWDSFSTPSVTESMQSLYNPTPQAVNGWSTLDNGAYNVGGFGAAGGNKMFEDLLGGFDLYGDVYSDPSYGSMGWGNETLDPELLRSLGIDTSYNTFLPTSAYNSMMDDQINAPALDSNGNPIVPSSGAFGSNVYLPGGLLGGLSRLFGGGSGGTGNGSGGGFGGSGGNFLDNMLSGLGGTGSGSFENILSKGAASVPILAAINYAQNSGNPDLSKLDAAYSNFNPDSLTGAYDLATGSGRTNLESSLARRGVSGSSFANSDLTNYDVTRDVGRTALLGQGAAQQANIANQILQNQIAAQKNKNDLYGRSLLALGSVFSPQKTSIFG